MIIDIFLGIPDNLKDRVIIKPHPLFESALIGSELENYIDSELTYEHALRKCAILITDYSSISYDAFNRGSNVIFWWRDKKECMRQYRGNLMLTEATAFGPVVYASDILRIMILALIDQPQSDWYAKNFRHIVNDFEGKSTQLLINNIKKDKVI